VILVTVGTNEAPFDRLLRAVGELTVGEPLLVQHGASSVRPPNADCVEFLLFDELLDAVRRARLVVTHAGVGSVLTVLLAGKRPIVVPRLRRFGEAVDDHQVMFGRRIGAAGLVQFVEEPAGLQEALRTAADDAAPVQVVADQRLVSELRRYLIDEVGYDPGSPAGSRR
jgi:UDP-N-acetylglucosamine transferase subunit ALG13